MYFLAQTVFVQVFYPQYIHITEYDIVDLALIMTVGLGAFMGQLFLVLANKYAMASRMAPFSNLEIVLSILTDIFLFNYHFIMTDVIGIAIIVACIFTPLIMKFFGKGDV